MVTAPATASEPAISSRRLKNAASGVASLSRSPWPRERLMSIGGSPFPSEDLARSRRFGKSRVGEWGARRAPHAGPSPVPRTSSLRTRRRTLPTLVFGSVSRNSIRRGTL